MPSSFRRVDTVFVHVRDLDGAARWYREVLGLRERFRTAHIVAFDVDQTALTLLGPTAHDGRHVPLEVAAFNFAVDDAEDAHRALVERGVEVDELHRVDESFAWFEFDDPDGNRLQVCSATSA